MSKYNPWKEAYCSCKERQPCDWGAAWDHKRSIFFPWFCICFETDILGMFCSPCNTAACCKYLVNSCGIFIATTMQLNRVVRCRSKVSLLKIRLRAQSSKRHQRELRATIHHPRIFSVPFLKNSESVHFVLVPCSDRPWMSSFHHASFSGAYWHSVSNSVESKWRVKKFVPGLPDSVCSSVDQPVSRRVV